MQARGRWWAALAGALACALFASPASGAVAHTVGPGETLWSIAAANNFTTRTIAAYNGLPENANVILGETIMIPTEAEGAETLREAGIVPGSDPASSSESPSSNRGSSSSECASASGVDPNAIVPAPGMGHVPSPGGALHLAPAAAAAWNTMRQEALRAYEIDVYPTGPLSAYRTYAQQAYLHCLYLSGAGLPANPPGTSSHETGNAVDVSTAEMRWVIDQIGWKHGWGKVHGPREWWHVDYVGG